MRRLFREVELTNTFYHNGKVFQKVHPYVVDHDNILNAVCLTDATLYMFEGDESVDTVNLRMDVMREADYDEYYHRNDNYDDEDEAYDEDEEDEEYDNEGW